MKIFWKAYCKEDRNRAINIITKIVNEFGSITDFNQFSDISINLRIELKENRIDNLYNALLSFMNFDEFEGCNSKSEIEVTINLNITFSSARGKLRQVVPFVPG